jgi:hypothetical protein
MLGETNSNGRVTITFDLNCERLAAPGGRQWLPCCQCGQVEAVEPNVVSFFCGNCSQMVEYKSVDSPDYSVMGGSVLTGRE